MQIGEFAKVGGVSVRMLRHWDAVGILVPDRVDEWSGRRTYTVDQLARLHTVVALRRIGMALEDIGQILTPETSQEELLRILHSRRAALEAEAEEAQAKLVEVSHRITCVERTRTMTATDIALVETPALRIAGSAFEVEDHTQIDGRISPVFARAAENLASRGVTFTTSAAVYEATEDGMKIFAGYVTTVPEVVGLEVRTLAAATCATIVHEGSMAGVNDAWQSLMVWVDTNGWIGAGPCVELYHRAGDDIPRDQWVTELRVPVMRP